MKLDPNKVRALQAHLRAKGQNIVADGAFGPATLDATLEVLGLTVAAPSGGLTPSHECIKLIQDFEGYKRDLGDGRVQSYPDPATGGEPWTIGWGTTGPDVKRGTIWTRSQAEARFTAHVAEFAAKVSKLLGGAATSQSQFDALVSFAYNLGAGNLASSTLLKKHKAGDYAGAAAEFGRWNMAAGKVMAGLTRRRAAEAKLYRG